VFLSIKEDPIDDKKKDGDGEGQQGDGLKERKKKGTWKTLGKCLSLHE